MRERRRRILMRRPIPSADYSSGMQRREYCIIFFLFLRSIWGCWRVSNSYQQGCTCYGSSSFIKYSQFFANLLRILDEFCFHEFFFFLRFSCRTLEMIWNVQKNGLEKNLRMDVYVCVTTSDNRSLYLRNCSTDRAKLFHFFQTDQYSRTFGIGFGKKYIEAVLWNFLFSKKCHFRSKFRGIQILTQIFLHNCR